MVRISSLHFFCLDTKKRIFQFSSSFFCLDTKKRNKKKSRLCLLRISFHFFVLTQKNETKKSQDCACFAQKTYARLTKSFKLAATQLKHERFFTSISLVFWLTRQGQFCTPCTAELAPRNPHLVNSDPVPRTMQPAEPGIKQLGNMRYRRVELDFTIFKRHIINFFIK